MTDTRIPDSFLFISPPEVEQNASRYAPLIANMINECYGVDYPAPTADSGYISQAIKAGHQLTCMWAVDSASMQGGRLGTLSLYDADYPFGEGIGELGKCATPGDGGGHGGFTHFERYWRDSPHARAMYQAFFCTSRNCGARPGKHGNTVRGGSAVKGLVLDVMQMERWGYAPWYLMPDDGDGAYELLDFCVRLPPRADGQVLPSPDVFLHDPAHAEFITDLFLHNGHTVPKITIRAHEGPVPDGWRIIPESYQQHKNPIKLVRSQAGGAFGPSMDELDRSDACTSVVILPLDARNVAAQRLVAQKGYVLCGVFPSIFADKPTQGLWCRLNKPRPLVLPKPNAIDHEQPPHLDAELFAKLLQPRG